MLVPRKQIQMYRDAIADGTPIGFALAELVGILDMALMVNDAADIIERIARSRPKRSVAIAEGVEWLKKLNDQAAPQAPCTANAPGRSPELASHKEAATPASRDELRRNVQDATPPGKSTDDARLPAQPAGIPLSRDERECAMRLADAAERMVSTFKEHLDVCGPCAINWQTLRNRLGQWESVTR